MSRLDIFRLVNNILKFSDSHMMNKHNEKKRTNNLLLSESGIRNLTEDYRFGLGTSMDKAVRPFSRTSAEL